MQSTLHCGPVRFMIESSFSSPFPLAFRITIPIKVSLKCHCPSFVDIWILYASWKLGHFGLRDHANLDFYFCFVPRCFTCKGSRRRYCFKAKCELMDALQIFTRLELKRSIFSNSATMVPFQFEKSSTGQVVIASK